MTKPKVKAKPETAPKMVLTPLQKRQNAVAEKAFQMLIKAGNKSVFIALASDVPGSETKQAMCVKGHGCGLSFRMEIAKAVRPEFPALTELLSALSKH